MALKEYKPGTAFTGVIGRTFDVSAAGVARAAARQGGRAERALHRAGRHRLRPAGLLTAARSRRRTSTRWPQNGLRYNNMHTTALCSPTRSCILTGRNHHSNAMSCITEGSTGYPGRQRQHPVRERLPVGDAAAARLQHLCRRQVAPDAGRPDLGGRPVRSLAARPRLRALLRLPRRRHAPVLSRSWCTTITGSSRRRRRRRATT